MKITPVLKCFWHFQNALMCMILTFHLFFFYFGERYWNSCESEHRTYFLVVIHDSEIRILSGVWSISWKTWELLSRKKKCIFKPDCKFIRAYVKTKGVSKRFPCDKIYCKNKRKGIPKITKNNMCDSHAITLT